MSDTHSLEADNMNTSYGCSGPDHSKVEKEGKRHVRQNRGR